jgi:hypothetical protein
LGQERRLLAVRIDEDDLPSRTRDRKRNPRYATARADVEQSQVCALRQMRQHGQRVEHVMRHHPRRLADRGQVVPAVPFREQRDIRVELRALCIG